MSYQQELSKYRRLIILKFLSEPAVAEFTSNSSMLCDICNKFGIGTTRDQIAGEIAWLAENGLVTHENNFDFIVVTATTRGLDVAAGRSTHEGVKRPSPKL